MGIAAPLGTESVHRLAASRGGAAKMEFTFVSSIIRNGYANAFLPLFFGFSVLPRSAGLAVGLLRIDADDRYQYADEKP